jgi:hypothetical protein
MELKPMEPEDFYIQVENAPPPPTQSEPFVGALRLQVYTFLNLLKDKFPIEVRSIKRLANSNVFFQHLNAVPCSHF